MCIKSIRYIFYMIGIKQQRFLRLLNVSMKYEIQCLLKYKFNLILPKYYKE